MQRWCQKVYDDLPDADVLLSYDTVKEVRVLDRRLGMIYYITLTIVAFHTVYVFMIDQRYLDFEKANGWAITKVSNPAITKLGLPMDLYDSITNPGEMGALFLPTRTYRTRGQKQGTCAAEPCQDECSGGAKCSGGFCQRFQWCPAEKPSDSAVTEISEIPETDSNYKIWLQSHVHFSKWNLDVYTTDEKKPVPYPLDKATEYPLHDFLRLANLNYNDTMKNGAIFMVNVIIDCDLDMDTWHPSIEARTVDRSTGFNYEHSNYYVEDGVRKRDLTRMFGYRISIFVIGNGTRTSFSMILLQISSAIALFTLAATAADFVLEYVIAERRHYKEQKILEADEAL